MEKKKPTVDSIHYFIRSRQMLNVDLLSHYSIKGLLSSLAETVLGWRCIVVGLVCNKRGSDSAQMAKFKTIYQNSIHKSIGPK